MSDDSPSGRMITVAHLSDLVEVLVTLLTSEEWAPHRVDEPLESDHVWGQIYRIPEELAPTVWPYLDHREKDGYTMRIVDVWGIRDGKEVVIEAGCRVYVGETDNPSFAGATPMRELAKVMASSVGPSGANREYLYLLCDVVRKLSPLSEDLYLKELERLVRQEEASL